MKHSIFVLLGVLVLVGAGCLNRLNRADSPAFADEPRVSEQVVSDLFGVIRSFDFETRTIQLLFPDEGADTVQLPESFIMNENMLGMLARVSGTRELPSRRVLADTLQIVTEPALHVTAPQSSGVVTSPLVVFGFVKTGTGELRWSIRTVADDKGAQEETIDSGIAIVPGTDANTFVPFRFEVFLPVFGAHDFVMDIFPAGNAQATVSLPLQLLRQDVSTFEIYFANRQKGGAQDCAAVFPISRSTLQTAAVARAAMGKLIEGPTSSEARQGYSSVLTDRVTLRSLFVNDRSVQVILAAPSNALSACQQQTIEEQVRRTLMQFPSVQEVMISYE